MPSLVPEFEYDIFISYRHNDNRSGWVTEFVSALREELSATIKEPLSIYFDKNVQDGLLETDDVDKSLEAKLKCLIFIPIISQTYCDLKSFAWKHEFCAFNRLSVNDKFGRNIKLNNGNVTNRILPVKIHELDADDKATIEAEIGGALRSIEFIFKSSGVNRPLRPLEDHPQDNLNHTYYRDQVNKVANAIKSIVQSTRGVPASPTTQAATVGQSAPRKRIQNGKLLLAAVVLLVLAAVSFWKYNTKQSETKPSASEDKSLVVLPFADMSPTKDQEWFSDGITEELLNSLSSLADLKLISRTTSFSFKGKGLSAKHIADSLGVAHVLEGSIRKSEDQLRVTVQLIKADDDTHLWSHVYEYTIDSVFKIQGDIAQNVASTLNLLLNSRTREHMFNTGTTSVEAYQEYLKGMSIYHDAHSTGNFNLLIDANKYLDKAIELYPNFANAYYERADVYNHSLLAGGNLEALKGVSEKQQYDRMMSDINKAIALAQTPGIRIGYSFTRDIFSNDWSKLSSYIDVKESWASGWETFLAMIDPDFVTNRYLGDLEFDPYDDMPRYFSAMGFANKDELDSALQLYEHDYTKSFLNSRVKSFLLFRKGEYIEARDAFSNFSRDTDGYSLFLKIINGEFKNKRRELDQVLAAQPLVDSYGYIPLLAYNALGEYDRADSVARMTDSRLLGHFSLCYNVLQFGLYFHLSATPRFAARLREFGIDPVAYEKKHYKQIGK